MRAWTTMVLVEWLVPVLMLAYGAWSKKGGPRSVNGWIGYRTAMSMKNEETWAFAHRELGRLWVKWGAITLLAAAVCMLPFIGRSEDVVGTAGCIVCMLEMIPLIGCLVTVENALNRAFDKDGNRREA